MQDISRAQELVAKKRFIYIILFNLLLHFAHSVGRYSSRVHTKPARLNMATSTLQNTLKVALCQIKVTTDKNVNINTASEAIDKAVQGQAQLICLPEVWNSPYATSSFPVYAEPIPSIGEVTDATANPSIHFLRQKAVDNNVWIVGGSIPERSNDVTGEKLYNTCVIINNKGDIVGKHRKVHLFDIDVPGRITFKESDSLSAGETVTIIESPWGNIGVGICYDIRFPELGILMRKRGCRMFIYPGAFNMVTGPAHWELLQRARAVDNQVYLAACSPARDEKSGGYIAWGHSSVISPWGEVVAKAGPEEEVIFADLDFEKVETMRQNIPCWFQKRDDLYEVVDKKSS